MKLRIISDLHLEFDTGWKFAGCGEDAVLCAGDLGVAATCAAVIERFISSLTVRFYYVIGNHDAYWGSSAAAVGFYRAMEKRHPQFRLLHNQAVDLGGYRLLGTPLWTDFALRGGIAVEQGMNAARRGIADFQLTHTAPDDRLLVPDDLLIWHAEARSFLKKEIEQSAHAIVLTHWSPTGQATPAGFASSPLEPYFTSNCEELLIPNVVLWAHGHTHDYDDRRINGTRLIRNPKGYPNEATNWNPGLVIELP